MQKFFNYKSHSQLRLCQITEWIVTRLMKSGPSNILACIETKIKAIRKTIKIAVK